MSIKQKSYLANLNRLVIFTLTLTGLLMDGYQASDLPFALALIVWLWLPLCTRVEAKILKNFYAIRYHLTPAGPSSIIKVGR